MHAILRLALPLAVSSLLACGTDDADVALIDDGTEPVTLAQGSEATPRGANPGTAPTPDDQASTLDWKAGDYPPNLKGATYLSIQHGTRARQYKVHVPKGYIAGTPAPILYAFHGLLQTPVLFPINGSSLVAKSDQEGFILVMPVGVNGSWNAGICCGDSNIDDVGFIRALHAELGRHVAIDNSRVYATGMSNGGFMSYRLACDAADVFVAVAPVAGAVGIPGIPSIGTNSRPDFQKCEPTEKVAVLAVHGDADPIVPYGGLKPSLDLWAAADGCQATTRPAQQPLSNSGATCITYEGCGEGIEVSGCSVAKGGHCWFGDASCGTGAPGIGNLFVGNNSKSLDVTDAVWGFVGRFRRAPRSDD
jgi:polyhydroxybutyrate depolymerase